MARHPEVHFRLKPEVGKGVSLIYLQFLFNRNRLFYSFGQTVEGRDWSEAKERVKKNDRTLNNGKYSINELLDHLEKLCIKSFNEAIKNGIPSPAYLKGILKAFINQNKIVEVKDRPSLFKLAGRFVNGEIKNRGKDKSSGSLKNYHAVAKHLKDYEEQSKYKIDFHTITLDFFYGYTSYLKALGLKPNTIAKDVSIVKVFMAEAVDLKYTTNNEFRHRKFSYSEVDTDAVFLNEKELEILYKHDFGYNKKLENVRDLFVFGAWVGLRFSDFSNIKEENIVDIKDAQNETQTYIKIITQKTNDLIYIPCHEIVLEIFEKYKHNKNRLPKTISNQKFNEYIKDVCHIAGLTEKGRLADNPELELWQCVASHTARRSAATNYYLQGFPVIDLMKITGHKTEKSFMKYIKISKLDAAKRLSVHMRKIWSERMLQVSL